MSGVPDRDIGVKEPSLVEHVKNILQRYPEGGQILKELIQNADDAGATEIKFMVDPRHHGNDNLWLPGLAQFQGPALVAWNNAQFNENDWESVFHIYQSLKKSDPMKVGRFGLGFISVYHITDLPYILSNDTIAVFDPCRKNINVRDKDGSSKTGHWLYLKDFRKYAGSVQCFEKLFGFSSQQDRYPGTIFRFPLRDWPSDISNSKFDCKDVIRKLYKSLVEEAPFILLFLKNVTKAGLYSYDEGCERLLYEVSIDRTSVHVVQEGRKICKEMAKNWQRRADIFCHLNSLSVSFKNNLLKNMPGEGIYHWLVMNCIAGRNCKALESSENLNVIPWAGVAAQVPVHIHLGSECCSVSLSSGRLDIGNKIVSAMLTNLSRCKRQVPWLSDKLPDLGGRAFCFLPLPSCTGLPVFIHGYFSVADNRRSIKWPSHDEHGEEASFNQALVQHLITPTYAFLLACRSVLIEYKEIPFLFENSHEMLDPYCMWPILSSHDGQTMFSIWSTIVDPLITQLVNHDLPVAWTTAGGGRRTSLLSAFYLPGTFTGIANNISNVVIEVLTSLDKPLVILPTEVAKVIARIQDTNIRQKIRSREISPSVIRSILRDTSTSDKISSILMDKDKCSAVLAYLLSDLSENNCHELENISLLPVEKAHELPRPFVKEYGNRLFILVNQQCLSFLFGVTDQLIWHGLPHNVLQQLKKVIGYKKYQLKIADDSVVCTELLPKSMSMWTNSNGGQVQWRPSAQRHPPLQWLNDVWSWLNKTSLDEDSISNLSIVPKERLSPSSSTVTLIPLSFSANCFLVSGDKSVPAFLPRFLENLGFMIVYETPIVFARSQIKEKFNPISPNSIIKVLTTSTVNISRVVESIKMQPHSDKTTFLHYIAQLTKTALSNREKQVIRQLPLFKPIGSNQFVSLSDQQWILLTNGIEFPPNLQCPPNIIAYSLPEECRLLKLLGCLQPNFTQLCTDHVIPFALNHVVDNTHNLMKWILSYQLDAGLTKYLTSCPFVPYRGGNSGRLVRPCDLFDPEDPNFIHLFDPNEDCIPSNTYRGYLAVLRKLGLQTWGTVSHDVPKLNQFLIGRAKSVFNLCAKNNTKAFNRSHMIVHLLSMSPRLDECLLNELANIPFLFCQSKKPSDYPKQVKWYGGKNNATFSPSEMYPVYYKLLIGAVGPVIDEMYGLGCQLLSGILKIPNILELFAQLIELTKIDKPSHDISKIVYLIYQSFNENKDLLKANRADLPSKWIWIETCCRFVSADKCAINTLHDLDLSPYYHSLSQLTQLKDFLDIFLLLGVPKVFNSTIVGDAFSNIKSECHRYGLDNIKLKTVLQILQWIHDTGEQGIKVLIPTESMQLLPPKDCTYNDLQWDERRMQQKGYTYVHHEVPSKRAKYFQVVPLSHRIAPSKRIGLKYIQRGPHQSVTGRLKEAIEEYGGDVDVFKELIQNADDAHATQIKFIIDWRQHPCNALIEPEMKHWQGPALLAYNNAVFTPNDLENICELAGGSKMSDPTKIGRFGIGFCAIYHLTDVPSFISNNQFMVFDPHTSYLGRRVTAGEPGMQIDMKEIYSNLDEFQDQFAPYCGLLNFDMTKAQSGYNSTFFRFPFRNDYTACRSKISTTIYDRGRVKELCDTLKRSAPDLLVFLQNVREISLYELDANSGVDKLKCLLSVTKSFEPTPSSGLTLIEQFRQGSNLEISQKKIFKIECSMADQMKQENHWIVTSCLGTGNARDIAVSRSGKSNGLCPLGEIGVKLDKSNSFTYPLSADGKLFCFLPLPIQCHLKFYCSGYFEVSKDRRWLKKDASSGTLNKWNSAIINDALYNCFIETLENLTKINTLCSAGESDKKKFLTAYYSLWPDTTNVSIVGRCLFHKLQQSIHRTTSCILWSDMNSGQWLSPNTALIYNHHDKVKQDIRKDIIQLLLQHRYPIVDIPYNIISIMSGSIRVIYYKDFCSKVLIPNIATLSPELRDSQIMALLIYCDTAQFDAQWAKELLHTRCIPTKPKGRLREPNNLIDPNSNLAKLYLDSDECFPIETYVKVDGVMKALKTLGMSYYQLPLAKLKERAQSVATLPGNEAIQRAKQILLYLSHVYAGYHGFSLITNIRDALCDIPFIPISKCPQGLSLPWLHSSVLFQSPQKVFSYKHKNLVFTQAPVVMSFDDDGNDHLIKDGLTKLGIIESKYPSVAIVTAHLVDLVKHAQKNSLNSNDCKLLSECCPEIYDLLQHALHNNFSHVSKSLRGLPFIWQSNRFLSVDQIKLDTQVIDAYPYLCELSDGNTNYKDLFVKLGVAEELDQNRLLSVLEVVNHDHKDKKLSEECIKFIITIAEKLVLQSLHGTNRVLYLPDESCIMRPASELAYKENVDLPALEGSKILMKHLEGKFWLHHMFPGALARSLGIPSALNSILNEMSNKNFLRGTEYGQCEDLCDRLDSILRKYPHDESIFKEFIQNSDDAGASEVVFILDHRNFDSQDGELFSSDPEWKSLRQCPSLLVYNNKLMSEDDIIGITKLGRGNKEFSPGLIGRFGIGFNVAYHITDCPTFVSYGPGAVPENFCILDPNGMFAPGHDQALLRGRRFEIDHLTHQQFYKEFDPFYNNEVFLKMSKMCDGSFSDIKTNFCNGCVLFRLPFTRSMDRPCRTALKSGYEMNTRHMQRLFKALSHSAEDLVLFLNNIKSISAFEIQENGNCLHYFTTSVSQSNQDAGICAENVKKLKFQVKNLTSRLNDEGSITPSEFQMNETAVIGQGSRSGASHDAENTQHNLFPEVCWDYQLKIQTIIHLPNSTVQEAHSIWFISQQFGSKKIPMCMLKAAISDGLIPRGGVAVQVYNSVERAAPFSLFCSLPLPIHSHMPVHVNGNFWVDDSRKHLEFGASKSTLTDWNCCLTKTVIADAYINALVQCKQFLPNESTEWYYSIFPAGSPAESEDLDSNRYPFGLYKTMYQMIVQKNLTILQQDTSSLTGSPTWLPVVGKGHGYFFSIEEGQQILRKLLIEFGIQLSKAPPKVYKGIKMAALACKVKYEALIDPVIYIQLLKSLNLQQHQETIIKNITILLDYCLSTEEGCNAIINAPLLLTYNGNLRQMSTVYGSKYAQLLPNKSDDFIHPELEKHNFIWKLKLFYFPVPSVDFVSSNLQLASHSTPVDVNKCPETHSQIIELWKYLNDYLDTIKARQHVTTLKQFNDKPIIPASNKTLVPVSKAKMVLSPNGGGPVREIMKLFGYSVLDFSVLCDLRFPTFAGALDKVLTHCNRLNGDDILECVELNNSSPTLPSNCDLTQYKEDLQLFLNIITTSTSLSSKTVQNCLCKLPIFEAVTGNVCSIKELQNTYLIPGGVPLVGLQEVMIKSSLLILKNLSVYDKMYKALKIQHCDVAQFYLKAIIPFFQAMNTKSIIKHVCYLFQLGVEVQQNVLGALKASKFIYVASNKRWYSASEFYDPRVNLLKMSFTFDQFPPQEWCDFQVLEILHALGLQKDLSWPLLFGMIKDVEQRIQQNIKEYNPEVHQKLYCKSKGLLGFIDDKLPVIQSRSAIVSEDPHVDRAVDEALNFCRDISQIVFVPMHEDNSIKKEIFAEVQDGKWTKFSTACFASHCAITYLERDIITASFSLNSDQQLYITALGIEHLPSCKTVIQNLLKLSQMTRSLIQSSKKQCVAIKNCIKKLFEHHYTYLEQHATPSELCLLQGKECLFVENLLTYFVVSSDCVVKNLPEPSFPYLCKIPEYLTEHQKIIITLKICDEPNSCHYARILERIYHEFIVTNKKLSENSKYLELASRACDCLVDMLLTEEANQSVPESFSCERLYLLDKQNELQKATELTYDDVPWYSKRLQNVPSYKYMKPICQGRHDAKPLPQSLGVKLLSSLVIEELDESVQVPDNHCADERRALQRSQPHGCQYVLSLQNLLLSLEFKLGLQRIIYHQKNGIKLTEREIALTDKLSKLEFTCYYKIITVLKQRNGRVIQGSSAEVFSLLHEYPDQNPLLYLAPHCDDSDTVVKELAQNINRHLSCIVTNESHLEAMIKCPSCLDIAAALDKCKVKSYTVADQSVQKLPSIGECMTPNITDLLIVLNYNKGESVKYWNKDGKLILAKVVAVKLKLLVDITAKSLTVCTSEDNDSAKISTSPIFVSKYLQPSFLENWLSDEKKTMDCSGLLLYHLEPNCDPSVIQKAVVLSFNSLSHHQISVVFKRLFFHLHFYFVKCNKQPKIFNRLSTRYFEEQVALFEPSLQPKTFNKWLVDNIEQIKLLEQSLANDKESDELSELFEDMCIYVSSEPDTENDSNICDEDMTGKNPFENREFVEQDDDEVYDNLYYIQRKQNVHYRKVHLQKAANISGTTRSQPRPTNVRTQPTSTQPTSSSSNTAFTNAFSQPVIQSTPTLGGLFKTSTGGYRSRARRPRPTPVGVWNQDTSRQPAAATASADAPPITNIKTAFMWLQQAIADFNAAKHYVECTRVTTDSEQVNASKTGTNGDVPCQFPALICFLSHEVVEKSLKAAYLAKCSSTLANQHGLNLVALYDQLSAARCWPLKNVKDYVLQVSDHNMRCRYPDHHVPPEAPCVLYTGLDARHALAAAQEVFVKVCSIECFKDKLPSQPSTLPLLPSTVYLDPNILPEEWEHQDTDLKLCLLDISANEEEFAKIASLFWQSLPDLEIRTIERIQNRVLWKKYSTKSKSMHEDNIPCRERILFHGTRQTSPKEIYEGDSSFDMRHSRDGSWGKGNYFAVNASLADGYAHRMHGVKKMLLARVLTGISFFSPPKRFVKPPPLHVAGRSDTGGVQRLYNSVTGQLGGSTVYITYENDLAYPAYIITYVYS